MRRKGLAAVTVRDVAEEMGTSSGLLHHYFGSVDEVLAGAFELAARADLDALRQAVATGPTPTERLRRFFDEYVPKSRDWTFQLWLDAWSEAARRPAIRSTSRRLNVEWQRLLAGLLRDGVAAGEFVSADPDAAAWRLLSMLDGLALQVIAHRRTVSRPTMLGWARRAAEQELGLDDGVLDPARGRRREPRRRGR